MAAWCAFICILPAIFSTCSYAKGDDSSYMTAEKRLYAELLRNYNPHLRPVHRNITETTTVHFGMAVINIVAVNEKQQTLTLNLWLRKLWTDYNLAWNPEDYDGVSVIRIPENLVWKPDIVLYNTASERYNFYMNPNVVVYSSGDVLWIPPLLIESLCRFDLKYFPFDTQKCSLKFGSWTYDGFVVDLEFYEGLEGVDLSDLVFHHEWTISETAGKKVTKYYPCCAEPYPYLQFNFTMKRIGTYYVYTFITPAVLIALLTPFVFLLSITRRQKFALGSGMMVCLCLLLMELNDKLPASEADLPILGQYYICALTLLALSLVLSVITTNMAAKANGQSHPPSWLKSVMINGLGRLLCVSHRSYSSLEDTQPVTLSVVRSTTDGAASPSGDDGTGSSPGKPRSHGIVEWRLIGIVFDRLFFIIFMVMIIIFSIVLLAH